jgi:hypothetical protein
MLDLWYALFSKEIGLLFNDSWFFFKMMHTTKLFSSPPLIQCDGVPEGERGFTGKF